MTLTPPSVLPLAEALMACPSVTPATGTVFDCLEAQLAPLGFAVHRFVAGEGRTAGRKPVCRAAGPRPAAATSPLPVTSTWSRRAEGWTSAPFLPEVRGELLHGRGAVVDMKERHCGDGRGGLGGAAEAGTLSFIITGDEEGPARFGTVALIEHMRAEGQMPDLCWWANPARSTGLAT